MTHHLNILSTQLISITGLFFVLEGLAWINQGFGIHPSIAGALACMCFVIPHLIRGWTTDSNK